MGYRPTTAAFVELAQAGVLRGQVLDVGCGTGEQALMAAGLGLEATGIDAAPAAIATPTLARVPHPFTAVRVESS